MLNGSLVYIIRFMGQRPSGSFALWNLLEFTFNISSFQSELNQPGI